MRTGTLDVYILINERESVKTKSGKCILGVDWHLSPIPKKKERKKVWDVKSWKQKLGEKNLKPLWSIAPGTELKDRTSELDPICLYCPRNKRFPAPSTSTMASEGEQSSIWAPPPPRGGAHSRSHREFKRWGHKPITWNGVWGGTHRLQDRAGPELTPGVRKQVQKAELQQRRQMEIARVFSSSSQGWKRKEGKQEATKTSLRKSTFSKTVGQKPGHKRRQQLHNTTAWSENRSPWDEPEDKIELL